MRGFLACSIAPSLALIPISAFAKLVEVAPGDDVEAAIATLMPGDELVLAGGMYVLTERFGISIAGTESQPIVIRAKDGEVAHFHRPIPDQNIVDVDSAQFVVFRGLEFSGGSAGVRLSNVSFTTIESCEIHDTGDVALRANDGGVDYDSLLISRNHIHHTNNTGEGMYLGCNGDACRVRNSIIEGNWVHHTNQASVDQGDGIEMKEGSHDNVIRDNVIHDTHYPCILAYSVVGNGGPNVIDRNVMWNCGDHGIQVAADAIVRNNVLLGSNANGIAMQPHQAGAPRNLVVVHNTVLHATNDAISVSDPVGQVTLANNALYAQRGSAIAVFGDAGWVTALGNVGEGGVSGLAGGVAPGMLTTDFVDPHYRGEPPIDLFPSLGSTLVGAGDPAHAVHDDFNCLSRSGDPPDAGAYGWQAGNNPGWAIQSGFRQCTDDPDDPGDETTGDSGEAGETANTETPSTMSSGGSSNTGSSDHGSSDTGSNEVDPSGTGDIVDRGCACDQTGRSMSRLATLSALALIWRRRRENALSSGATHDPRTSSGTGGIRTLGGVSPTQV